MSRFSDLPEFLKEYVHENRWADFREIQNLAFEAFEESEGHILISSATSSGKTEAAMFPVISSLYADPPEGVGALYIGPLKALIDDQFERIAPMLKNSGIKVTGWHGDIGPGAKKRLMKEPEGILQITPESLQNVITDHSEVIPKMFSGLRFVIIDEVHTFMASDRGQQLLCCLSSIERIAGCRPRRIGLSATIADIARAEEWLAAGSGIGVTSVLSPSERKASVKISYSHIPPEEDPEGRKKAVSDYYKELFSEVRGHTSIVFTNSRVQAERTARSLGIVAEKSKCPMPVSVHHGSVSKEYRKTAETELKDSSRKTVAVATSTLELGIDVGDVDRIVQIDPPFSCSSFLQRMGRSGRRGASQEMTVHCVDDEKDQWKRPLGISVGLIKSIAITELALGGWTETPKADAVPYGLLYHQTMEYLKSGVGARVSDLKRDVLSMFPFRNITEEEYKVLLRHMWTHGDLKRMDDGTLLIGPKAEGFAYHRSFCTVFSTKKEVLVYSGGKHIGSIQEVPAVGSTIQLAGQAWIIRSYNDAQSRLDVERTDGEGNSPWTSDIPDTDDAIMIKMREVLMSDEEYPYLDGKAKERLAECRETASQNGMCDFFTECDWGVRICPWLGNKAFDTVRRAVKKMNIGRVYAAEPYYMEVVTDASAGEIASCLERVAGMRRGTSLIFPEDRLAYGKFDSRVPEELLRKSFAANRLSFGYGRIL